MLDACEDDLFNPSDCESIGLVRACGWAGLFVSPCVHTFSCVHKEGTVSNLMTSQQRFVRKTTEELNTVRSSLVLFLHYETSPIIWIGKPAPALQW
jgi:hypothetical protein